MSEENAEVVRGWFARTARGDFSPFAELNEDFVFVTSPELPDAGTYRGEAARRWLEVWVESFEGLTVEATEIVATGEKVLAGILQQGRLAGSERVVEGRWWGVYTFRDGEPVELQLFPDRVQALGAAGLESRDG
jgi:ketosteroid isomerase-like protein